MQTAVAALWTELVDASTDVVQAVLARVRRVPTMSLVLDEHNIVRTENGEPLGEDSEGLAGAACRLSLPREWFFRATLNPVPIESLPFLEAFVGQQIDRVTPWHRSDIYLAISHQPSPDEPTRLLPVVTVVPKSLVASHIAMLEGKGCSGISVWSTIDGEHVEIPVGGSGPHLSFRRRVATGLALVFVILPTLAGICWWRSAVAQAQTEHIVRQLVTRREALVRANSAAGEGGSGLQTAGLGSPRTALILEYLSAALPDSVYLTELSIAKDRASISGIALNPPELVPILENTGHFSDVTFSDATTKTRNGAGNRFSLEMRIVSEKEALAK